MPFDKTNLATIQELVELIKRTELLVDTLGRMVPQEEKWLQWRHRNLERQLEDSRRELKKLIDRAQEAALRRASEDRKERRQR